MIDTQQFWGVIKEDSNILDAYKEVWNNLQCFVYITNKYIFVILLCEEAFM